MNTVLLVAQIIIVLSLITVILLQSNASDGLAGLGGSGGSGLLSSRGKANLLTRTTSFLAALFILNSLALAWLASYQANTSIVEEFNNNSSQIELNNEAESKAKPVAEPEVPLGD